MVLIVETGIFLMELDCYSLVICMKFVELRELSYIVPLLLDQLVSITVILQLLLSMMMTSQ